MLTKNSIAFVFAVIAMVMVWVVNVHHPLGINPDSINYLEFARNLQAGNGFKDDMGVTSSHWPPGYSAALSIAATIGNTTPIKAALYLQSVLAFIYVIVCNVLLFQFTTSRKSIMITNILLITGAPFGLFFWILSEGLFMVLLILTSIILWKYQQHHTLKYIITAGILSGIMLWTRYAAIGFIGGMGAYILFFSGATIKQRVKASFLYAALSGMLLFALFYYYKLLQAPPTDRTFGFHPPSFTTLLGIPKTLANWFVPFKNTTAVTVSLIVIFSLSITYLKFQKNIKTALLESINTYKHKLLFLVLPSITYVLFLIFSISTLDAYTPLNTRILAPIFVFLLIAIIVVILENKYLVSNVYGKLCVAFIGTTILCTAVYNTIQVYKEGLGYASVSWKTSETMNAVSELKNTVVYTNAPNAVLLYQPHLRKSINAIPSTINRDKKKETSFEANMQILIDTLKNSNVSVVYFNSINKSYHPSKNRLLKALKPFKVKHLSDGFLITK